jgi:PDDEXK-like domain of unknown function (DUF3799)
MQIPDRKTYDATAALNYSGAKALIVSGLHYQAYLNQDREVTPALTLGSALHCAVLQPELYAGLYATAPEGIDRRTTAGKAAFAEFATINEGKTILKSEDSLQVERMATAARDLLARHKVTIVKAEVMYTVDYCGCPLKSAIDLISEDGYIWDLKSCLDASPKGFLAAVRSYRYNLQQHFYRTVYEIETKERPRGFRFACVEKETTATAVYELGPELTSYAVADFEKAVTLYKSCTALGEWPGYSDDVQTIDLNAPTSAATPINFA